MPPSPAAKTPHRLRRLLAEAARELDELAAASTTADERDGASPGIAGVATASSPITSPASRRGSRSRSAC